jgi:hypothetical protein
MRDLQFYNLGLAFSGQPLELGVVRGGVREGLDTLVDTVNVRM